jgi:bacterioferritin
MNEKEIDKKAVVTTLNRILEAELAGVVRYTHYSLMVYGYSRIPIVSWLRDEATTSMSHAQEAGEMITALGEHPSLGIGALLETHNHDIGAILKESLEFELEGLALYRQLLDLVRDRSITLEDYARKLIAEEQLHVTEIDKMLRKPGDVKSVTL